MYDVLSLYKIIRILYWWLLYCTVMLVINIWIRIIYQHDELKENNVCLERKFKIWKKITRYVSGTYSCFVKIKSRNKCLHLKFM